MIALAGDAELDEGNIYKALLESAKHGLRHTWWIVDYNRQSLDGIVREGLSERARTIFQACGWDVVVLKHGRLQEAAFREPGGRRLKTWIDDCSNARYSALSFQGGDSWRRQLASDFADNCAVAELIGRRTDDELSALMSNLGGHDIGLLVDTFEAMDHDRPTLFLAYTIKGHGLPLAGHKDNHAGLMTPGQMDEFRDRMGVPPGLEWDPFAGAAISEGELRSWLSGVEFNSRGRRRYRAPAVPIAGFPDISPSASMSTQEGFGKILGELARADTDLARRIVTTSPDVSVSTNLGPFSLAVFSRSGHRFPFGAISLALISRLAITTHSDSSQGRAALPGRSLAPALPLVPLISRYIARRQRRPGAGDQHRPARPPSRHAIHAERPAPNHGITGKLRRWVTPVQPVPCDCTPPLRVQRPAGFLMQRSGSPDRSSLLASEDRILSADSCQSPLP